ncbi:MAG: adenine methylase [Thermoanaerobaculia bacterium]|jgi:DNA adenine methylase|nr:adenine methylase [Thermoanaerobaculia bacterium]
MKSIIRWAGSKRSLLPELRASVPETFSRYVEPFVGSACLFFDLQPKEAILSDLNEELIGMYRAVRRDPYLVLEAFRRLPRGKKAYYRIRGEDPKLLASSTLAARFLYLNRFCFNGLYRTNMSGRFNVPYGPPQKPLVVFEDDVIKAGIVLRRAELFSWDFARTIDLVEKGDFVYLDPPFVLDERRVFTEYLPGSFSRDDIGRLSEALQVIHQRGATFLLSYASCCEAQKLTKPWKHRTVWTRRNIAGFSGARRGDHEILASNRSI